MSGSGQALGTDSARGWTARPRWSLAVAVAALAFVARLVPVLRGGGLFGLGDYDDGVYYSAAVGLVHGRLPYRDFLLLHPPGIVLALAPFAALGRLVGDPAGFATARLAWMVLGAANTLLVIRVLGRRGSGPALLGGLLYALFLPAVYGEHTTQLEGPGTTCLLVALLLLAQARRASWSYLLAGAALGLSASIKIWGVAAVAITACWAMATSGLRHGRDVAAGAVAAAALVCLPFFLVAPGPMSRMVVLDQLGRPQTSAPLLTRLSAVCGLSAHGPAPTALVVAALVAFAALAALAAVDPAGRLAVGLLLGLTVVLMVTPSWFAHYASLTAGPAAVTVGHGTAQLVAALRRSHPRLAGVAATGLAVLVCAYVAPLSSAHYGEPFPGDSLAVAAARKPGCVTTDDPTTLVEMNLLGRNLRRGCDLVVDLSGHSYDDASATPVARSHNRAWQRYALAYLESGSVVLVARLSSGQAFSPSTADVVRRWRVLKRLGRFRLRTVVRP